MSGFTRVTLVGSSRRGDLAVPDDEPLGVLLPRLLDLLDEPAGPVTRALALVRVDGASLDLAGTVAGQDVRPGDVLRVVRAEAAPPPPEVAQVTDVVGAVSGERGDRWTDATRAAAGLGALAVLAAATALLAATPLADALTPEAARLVPLVGAAAACVVAVGCGLGRWTWGVAASTGVALGTGVTGAVAAAVPDGPSLVGWVLPVVTAAGLVAWTCLGTCVGLVLGRRAVVAGAGLGVVVLMVPLAAGSLGPTAAAGVGAVVGVLLLGLLPRYALAVAGLPRLDDRAVQGDSTPWDTVHGAAGDAHAALTWSVVAVSLDSVATVGSLAASSDPWARGLAGCVVLATALRARTFPSTTQHVVLWCGLAAALAQGLAARAADLSLGSLALVALVLAVAVVTLTLVRPPEHVRATLRRVGDVAELVAVMALAPLLVGVLGVYADLLVRFR